ncbi:hypothetical protein W02_33030 [Nitrospira sp. KM1]|uniref:hypothetical protein n=1 Tax=Nitrospira sp. KM1 TaxID=1936990 RepID=UPI0013A7A9D2|nr:hypothetical protein [Nitrospira sp. KM1]BCA56163.1 hypothetical protein W02_33030 [Nitrospira sp. KM1]
MTAQSVSHTLEKRILTLGRQRPRMMFTDLALEMHDCTWHRLFAALNRLQQDRAVELIACRTDYEIRFLRIDARITIRDTGTDSSTAEES